MYVGKGPGWSQVQEHLSQELECTILSACGHVHQPRSSSNLGIYRFMEIIYGTSSWRHTQSSVQFPASHTPLPEDDF